MPVPQGSDWMEIAEGFSTKWAFPHCLGTIDRKHDTVKAPADSGYLYYNNKDQFSIVLLAVVDANYLFRVVNIGAYGKSSDGGSLSACAFGREFVKFGISKIFFYLISILLYVKL